MQRAIKAQHFYNAKIKELEESLIQSSLQAESNLIFLERQKEDNKKLKNNLEILEQQLENKIEKPTYSFDIEGISLDNLKKSLKLGDRYTLSLIRDYLNLDNYEIIKNLASVTNDGNVRQIMAYRDGALGRNEALINLINESIKGKTFIDRITNEIKETHK